LYTYNYTSYYTWNTNSINNHCINIQTKRFLELETGLQVSFGLEQVRDALFWDMLHTMPQGYLHLQQQDGLHSTTLYRQMQQTRVIYW